VLDGDAEFFNETGDTDYTLFISQLAGTDSRLEIFVRKASNDLGEVRTLDTTIDTEYGANFFLFNSLNRFGLSIDIEKLNKSSLEKELSAKIFLKKNPPLKKTPIKGIVIMNPEDFVIKKRLEFKEYLKKKKLEEKKKRKIKNRKDAINIKKNISIAYTKQKFFINIINLHKKLIKKLKEKKVLKSTDFNTFFSFNNVRGLN
jgi:hypothetical protein